MFPGTIPYYKLLVVKPRAGEKALRKIDERLKLLNKWPNRSCFDAATKLDYPHVKQQLIEDQVKLERMIQGNPRGGIVHNAAYVFFNGQKLASYKKHAGYHELVYPRKRLVFAPGSHHGHFKCGGYDFGLEVCRDHKEAIFVGHNPNRKLHVQVILSAYVDTVPKHLALAPRAT